jgi:hypothetical protein
MPIPVLLPTEFDIANDSDKNSKGEMTPSFRIHPSKLGVDSQRHGFPNAIYAKRGPFQFSRDRIPERMFPFYNDFTTGDAAAPSSTPIRWTASRNMPIWGAVTALHPGNTGSFKSDRGGTKQPRSAAQAASSSTAASAADLDHRYRRIRETGQYTVSSVDCSVVVGFGGLSLLYRQASSSTSSPHAIRKLARRIQPDNPHHSSWRRR